MSKPKEDLKTPLEHFYHWEKQRSNQVFLRQPYGRKWKTLTYVQAGQEARRMAVYLKSSGLKRGDHVGLLSKNCYHWILADLAIMMAACVSVPYYPSLPARQLQDVIIRSDIKLLFVGKLDKWNGEEDVIPSSLQIVRFPYYQGNAKITSGLSWESIISETEPMTGDPIPDLDDLWTILFTSGTTGHPKGVMHSHRNPALVLAAEKRYNFVGLLKLKAYRYFSFLPLNHVAERIAIETSCLFTGGTISFAESIDTFAVNLRDTQPTILFAVPRIWTKFREGVLSKISQGRLDFLLNLPLLGKFFRRYIRKAMGLGAAEILATGAAISPAHVKEWYRQLDISLIEVYGMTEICGAISYGVSDQTPVDSVGSAAPLCDIRIDENSGEVLLWTEHMMLGYYNDPEKTDEVLQNGWIFSGDKGSLDENGFLRIEGRVKDAFKTSKGKYISPNPLEESLLQHEYIGQVCVVGLGIPQPIALVNLSESGVIADRDRLMQSLQQSLKVLNNELAAFQRISTIVIQNMQWSVDNQLLTPTLKVRRTQMDERYAPFYQKWHKNEAVVIWE